MAEKRDSNSGDFETGTRSSSPIAATPQQAEPVHETFGKGLLRTLKTPGSALQIVLAALLAVAIGLAVTTTVDDIPEAAPAILEVPGSLWLRALRATAPSAFKRTYRRRRS